MAIRKSIGKTPTEQLLAALCERSFLKLWSYPNPYRDDGKELCDLLGVFENQIFIFVDRESRNLQTEDVNQRQISIALLTLMNRNAPAASAEEQSWPQATLTVRDAARTKHCMA